MSWWLFSITKEGGSPTSLAHWQSPTCQCTVPLAVKKCSLMFQRKPVFQFVPTAFGPVSGHHWKEPGSVLIVPSLWVHTGESPLSLLQAEQSQFSQPFLVGEMLVSFVDLYWTLASTSMSLLYWGGQHWTQYSTCGLTSAEERGGSTSLSLLLNLLFLWCSPGYH